MTIQFLDRADALRQRISPGLTREWQSVLGQFMTPSPLARFIALLCPPATLQTCRLLDAGVGALSKSDLNGERFLGPYPRVSSLA